MQSTNDNDEEFLGSQRNSNASSFLIASFSSASSFRASHDYDQIDDIDSIPLIDVTKVRLAMQISQQL